MNEENRNLEDTKTLNELLEENEKMLSQSEEKRVAAVDDFNYLLGENGFEIPEEGEKVEDAEEVKPVKKGKSSSKKKKKRGAKGLKTTIWILVIFAISIILAFGILLVISEFLGIGFNKGNKCVVEIEKGMSTAEIAEELKEEGAISSELLFRFYSKIAGHDGTYQYGVYTFNNELGYPDLVNMLQTKGAVAQSVEVTIPERASMDEIMQILEDNGVCTKADFRNAVKNGDYDFDFVDQIPVSDVHYKFEGYLFPDTYEFYNYDSAECAELAIRKMLQNLDNKLTQRVRGQIEESGYTIHEVLTMASVIELEASSSGDDMPKVAAVFYNRLESPDWIGPRRLESDPTMEYPYGNGRYDTYKNEGLPPGPMCAPSENAILAAASPEENFTATYFVTDNTMKFYYNTSLAAHQATIASLKAQGKWYIE